MVVPKSLMHTCAPTPASVSRSFFSCFSCLRSTARASAGSEGSVAVIASAGCASSATGCSREAVGKAGEHARACKIALHSNLHKLTTASVPQDAEQTSMALRAPNFALLNPIESLHNIKRSYQTLRVSQRCPLTHNRAESEMAACAGRQTKWMKRATTKESCAGCESGVGWALDVFTMRKLGGRPGLQRGGRWVVDYKLVHGRSVT